jgi:hypothetical protein
MEAKTKKKSKLNTMTFIIGMALTLLGAGMIDRGHDIMGGIVCFIGLILILAAASN